MKVPCRNIFKQKQGLKVRICIGFLRQGFGSTGGEGTSTVTASHRSCQKLPLCLIEPTPAGSKSHPLLVKAELISSAGRGSGITYWRRAKKTVKQQLQLERGTRTCPQNSYEDTKGSRHRSASGAGSEIPLQPVVQTMLCPCSSQQLIKGAEIHLQPVEVHGGVNVCPQPVEHPMPEQVAAQKRL